jgi:hypothetical protein
MSFDDTVGAVKELRRGLKRKRISTAGKSIHVVRFFERIASDIDLKRLRKTGIIAIRQEGILCEKVGHSHSSCKPVEPLKRFR